MGDNRNQLLYLDDMIESIEFIQHYIDDLTEAEFEANQEKQDAVLRRLEIIGEATKSLSQELKRLDPTVPWRQMAGMRDVTIHQYFGVSTSLIWNVVRTELPDVLPKLINLRSKYEG